jgi:hypothetical protein
MDLKDATLMFLAESAASPGLHRLAQSVYNESSDGRAVPHTVLSELLGEASGKGVLQAMKQQHSAAAFDSIIVPICRENDRQRPVPPRYGGRTRDRSDLG